MPLCLRYLCPATPRLLHTLAVWCMTHMEQYLKARFFPQDPAHMKDSETENFFLLCIKAEPFRRADICDSVHTHRPALATNRTRRHPAAKPADVSPAGPTLIHTQPFFFFLGRSPMFPPNGVMPAKPPGINTRNIPGFHFLINHDFFQNFHLGPSR